ncbi:MAG: hypothetical protein AMXMBFR84_30260 [Candidatus Hydrogenedentota bacterium]
MITSRTLAATAMGLFAAASFATEYEVDRAESVFAIVTYKEGLASRFAHNHFVVATDYEMSASMDEGVDSSLRCTFQAKTASLTADDPDLQAKWWPKVKETWILKEGFSTVPEEDRKNVQQTMLSDAQLDATAYPEITATVKAAGLKPRVYSDKEYMNSAEVSVTIKGVTLDLPVYYDAIKEGDTLSLVAVAPIYLTRFNIEPYSAFLGAVRVKDRCHIYINVRLKAKPVSLPANENPAE